MRRRWALTVFGAQLTRREIAAGLIYLPIHFVLLPLLMDALALRWGWSVGVSNVLYYGVGVVYLGVFFLPWLQRQFNLLWDTFPRPLGSFGEGYLIYMALSMLVSMLLVGLGVETPESAQVLQTPAFSDFDWRAIKAVSIYLAPVLSETLFRGVLFGWLYPRGPIRAYVITVLLFALAHVWPYASVYRGWTLLAYFLQYLPAGIALCRSFVTSGTVWVPTALLMLTNALGYMTLSV